MFFKQNLKNGDIVEYLEPDTIPRRAVVIKKVENSKAQFLIEPIDQGDNVPFIANRCHLRIVRD